MLILNFTHPLTDEHKAEIEALTVARIDEVRTIPVQINQAELLEAQISALVDAAFYDITRSIREAIEELAHP